MPSVSHGSIGVMITQMPSARATEDIGRFSIVHASGGNLQLATALLRPTGIAPRPFQAGTSATYSPLVSGGVYVGVLAQSCVQNDELFLDAPGKLSPFGAGSSVGRALASALAGSTVEFVHEPAATGGGGGGPRLSIVTSELRALADIAEATPVDMNAAMPGLTSVIGLQYNTHDPGTAATFESLYGVKLVAYVNGMKVQQPDISRNDADPAGHVRFAFDVPKNAELVFESRITTT